jgi:iron-sulfur cluster repair protein YtfE (RIC family)
MNVKPARTAGGRVSRRAAVNPDGDAIAYLERQHREVEELFRQIETADAEDGRAAILRTISDGLAIHAAIEEHHLYAALRPKLADTISDGTMDNHRGIKRILSDIVDVSVGDPNFAAKLKELREEVERHVASEERKLFPKIRRLMPAAELAGIAHKMREEQAALEGTEPRLQVHPDRLPSARVH